MAGGTRATSVLNRTDLQGDTKRVSNDATVVYETRDWFPLSMIPTDNQLNGISFEISIHATETAPGRTHAVFADGY